MGLMDKFYEWEKRQRRSWAGVAGALSVLVVAGVTWVAVEIAGAHGFLFVMAVIFCFAIWPYKK